MNKLMTYVGYAILAATVLGGAAAFGQDGPVDGSMFPDLGLRALGIGLGCGLVVMGGGKGIGNIGSSAVESMARQPEAAKDISGAMLLSAAFVEGATLFGVLTCLLIMILL